MVLCGWTQLLVGSSLPHRLQTAHAPTESSCILVEASLWYVCGYCCLCCCWCVSSPGEELKCNGELKTTTSVHHSHCLCFSCCNSDSRCFFMLFLFLVNSRTEEGSLPYLLWPTCQAISFSSAHSQATRCEGVGGMHGSMHAQVASL